MTTVRGKVNVCFDARRKSADGKLPYAGGDRPGDDDELPVVGISAANLDDRRCRQTRNRRAAKLSNERARVRPCRSVPFRAVPYVGLFISIDANWSENRSNGDRWPGLRAARSNDLGTGRARMRFRAANGDGEWRSMAVYGRNARDDSAAESDTRGTLRGNGQMEIDARNLRVSAG